MMEAEHGKVIFGPQNPIGTSLGTNSRAPYRLESPLLRDTSEDYVQDECGIFGVFGHEEAATLTYLGLRAVQHRGQEGAGIVSSSLRSCITLPE